jgi:hypothetical protein
MRQRTTKQSIELGAPDVEQLAATRPPDTNLSTETLDELAALAWEIQRRELGGSLTPPYRDLSEHQRASCRVSVRRTVQALVMLGWIDLPS